MTRVVVTMKINNQKNNEFNETIHVLVTDDNQVNRRVTELMLLSLGYKNCTLAVDGRDAVDASRQAAFDVILMDLQMPVLNGFDAMRTIRQDTGSQEAPWMIALTGSLADEDIAEARMAGANDVLFKPFNCGQLEDVLMRAQCASQNKMA